MARVTAKFGDREFIASASALFPIEETLTIYPFDDDDEYYFFLKVHVDANAKSATTNITLSSNAEMLLTHTRPMLSLGPTGNLGTLIAVENKLHYHFSFTLDLLNASSKTVVQLRYNISRTKVAEDE